MLLARPQSPAPLADPSAHASGLPVAYCRAQRSTGDDVRKKHSAWQEALGRELVRVAAKSARAAWAARGVQQMRSPHDKTQSFKKAREALARGEQAHYDFWKTYTPAARVKV